MVSLVTLASGGEERYLRLEHLCSRPIWDAREAYEGGSNKESRRVEIAKLLSTEVTNVFMQS